jgi:CRP-like cAMP-binding protein
LDKSHLTHNKQNDARTYSRESATSPTENLYIPFYTTEIEKIKLKTINATKGQILQRSGELNTKVFTVKSGLLRSYSIDNKGKEHIYMFAPENWIIADNCEGDIPCDLYIDAIEDSTITVTEKDFTKLTSDRKSLIKRINVLQKRVIMLMSSSAVERYQHFVETYPDIIQRVPQRMIASYLGITPEALSRLRKEISKNK